MLTTQPKRSEETQAAEAADRRIAPRIRTLQKGQLFFLNSNSAIECIILNISETGACLRPTDVKSCPDRFQLRCHDGEMKLCQLVWRSHNDIGVRFE